jgi:hypothetical protein
MINCPVSSPDGKLIAYVSDATGILRVHIQDLSGSFHKENKPQSFTLNPLWLPDSRQVAANERIYSLSGDSSYLSTDIKKLLRFSSDNKHLYYIGEVSPDVAAIIQADRSSGAKTTLMRGISNHMSNFCI